MLAHSLTRGAQLSRQPRTCSPATAPQPVQLRRVEVRAQPSSTAVQADPYKRLIEAEAKGETVEAVVKGFNKGGLVVAVGPLKGFVPYKQMAAETMRKGHLGDMSFLIGQTLKTKVLVVDMQNPKDKVVLSEKKAVQSEKLRLIKKGAVMRGIVTGLEEYGAFVEMLDVPGVIGMVHKKELSWDRVLNVDSVLKKGQTVSVKVLEVDPVKCRMELSIKQLSPDPLKQTLDNAEWGPTRNMPPEIARLVERLRAQQGIQDVLVMRQATEVHLVAQELQVFLVKGDPASGNGAMASMSSMGSMDGGSMDGYVVVARLGSVLQELQLVTNLSRLAIKEVLSVAVKAV